jgi:hypothetical protein
VRGTALLLLAAIAGGTGCSDGDDEDTLQPLPIEGATDPAPSTSTPASVAVSTTGARATTTSAMAPIGDWDGARFDAGTIETLSRLGAYQTIGFDRYSFVDPVRGAVDAAGFDEEPVAAWWRTNPFTNVRVQLRTFVLDTDVEVLTLDAADRARACAEPPPTSPPTPSWEPAGVEALEDPDSVGAIALLTYSPTGQVTRIRLTHGC